LCRDSQSEVVLCCPLPALGRPGDRTALWVGGLCHSGLGPKPASMFASVGRLLRSSLVCPAASEVYKTSTGLVGLAVNPRAREDLIAQQKQLLEKIKVRSSWRGPGRERYWGRGLRADSVCRLSVAVGLGGRQKIPEEAEYRKVVTQLATFRLKKAEEIKDVSG
jgi:hypothetical protein